jgi:hypothetical protein
VDLNLARSPAGSEPICFTPQAYNPTTIRKVNRFLGIILNPCLRRCTAPT